MFDGRLAMDMDVREHGNARELMLSLELELQARYGRGVPEHLLRNYRLVLRRLIGWQQSLRSSGMAR